MMKRISDLVTGIFSIVFAVSAVYIIRTEFFGPKGCEWVPLPPDNNICWITYSESGGVIAQLGRIIVGIAWPF